MGMRHKHRPKPALNRPSPALPSFMVASAQSAPPLAELTPTSAEPVSPGEDSSSPPLEAALETPAEPSFKNASSRHDGWTAERQRRFCEVLAETGLVDRAAKSVGMSRESAYRLRRRDAGRAFALAWDAALLLARQLLIDEAFTLAFEGSVDRIIRDGEVVGERRRRDPRMILEILERLGSRAILGNDPAQAVAHRFDAFLDCMEADAAQPVGASGSFMRGLATDASLTARHNLTEASKLLNGVTPLPDGF